jgi:hypothetical protein
MKQTKFVGHSNRSESAPRQEPRQQMSIEHLVERIKCLQSSLNVFIQKLEGGHRKTLNECDLSPSRSMENFLGRKLRTEQLTSAFVDSVKATETFLNKSAATLRYTLPAGEVALQSPISPAMNTNGVTRLLRPPTLKPRFLRFEASLHDKAPATTGRSALVDPWQTPGSDISCLTNSNSTFVDCHGRIPAGYYPGVGDEYHFCASTESSVQSSALSIEG